MSRVSTKSNRTPSSIEKEISEKAPCDESIGVNFSSSPVPKSQSMSSVQSKKEFSKITHVDVVGVSNNGNGRSCSIHGVCGDSVRLTDKLYCDWKIQYFPEKKQSEEVVRVLKINDNGLAVCHVGYIPTRYFNKYSPIWFDGKTNGFFRSVT